MKLRPPLALIATTLAACAAVTGLGDYAIVDEAGEGDGGPLTRDGAARSVVQMQCTSTLSCNKVCCHSLSEADAGCVELGGCSELGELGQKAAFTCDDPSDCLSNEACCVQVYTVPVPIPDAGDFSLPLGARCAPKGTCKVDLTTLVAGDAGSSGVEEVLTYLSASEACDRDGRCVSGVCTPFPDASSLGANFDLMPNLRRCK
ncbi:MAG: hypothetical protein U0270_14210 [Labilithrix sp.]